MDRIRSINAEIKTNFISLDLSSQQSVRKAAAKIDASTEKIDLTINNAAIMACPWAKTMDGIESQFGTNYVGHFLLTNLIMPRILAAKAARIVNVSSSAHRMGNVRLYDWNFKDGAEYNPWSAYGAAKTATILFTMELASRLKAKHTKAFSLNPGSIKTNLQTHLTPVLITEAVRMIVANTGREFPMPEPKNLQQGCSTTLVAALDPTIPSGSYLDECAVGEAETYATDKQKASQLWSLSEQLVGQKFDW